MRYLWCASQPAHHTFYFVHSIFIHNVLIFHFPYASRMKEFFKQIFSLFRLLHPKQNHDLFHNCEWYDHNYRWQMADRNMAAFGKPYLRNTKSESTSIVISLNESFDASGCKTVGYFQTESFRRLFESFNSVFFSRFFACFVNFCIYFDEKCDFIAVIVIKCIFLWVFSIFP